MGPWLLAAAWAGEPIPVQGLDAYRRSALYVVDAYVIRSVRFDLMGIHWTAERRPPGTSRQIRYCVVYDRPPVEDQEATVISEEWVVVDGSGAPLTAERFGELTGLLPRRWQKRGAMLGGAQLGYSRQQAEEASARIESSAAGIPSRTRAAIRQRVVSSLPTTCSDAPPVPISGR